MANLLLWSNFNKRINSTKIPALESAIVKTVHLKEATSYENPVFILDEYNESWSYCAFESHLYFINDVVFTSDHLYELHCTQDLLGTYRDKILDTRCNILYANGSTKDIIDQRIPIQAGVTFHENTLPLNGINISGYNTSGDIVVGITGKGSFGAYLLQSRDDVNSLLDGVDNWATETITDTLAGLKQLIYGGSASQCLKSAIALPLSITNKSDYGELEDLYLGNYPCKKSDSSAIKGYHISKPVMTSVTTINIPWQYSDWRRNAPYSEVILYLPFIGVVTLPANGCKNDTALEVTYAFNLTSGDIAVEYSGKQSGRIFGTASGNIAMATAYGSTGIDTTKLTSSAVAGVGSLWAAAAASTAAVATGGATLPITLGLAGGLAAAAGGTISALGGSGSGSGGLGGGASQGLDRVIHCIVITRTLTDTQDNFSTIMGKPYMATGKPSSFSGFVMTEGFSIDIDGFYNDRLEINTMMDRGVYIE